MKDKMSKVFAKIADKRGVVMATLSLSVVLATCMFPVFAAASDAVAALLGIVLKIFQYIGALLLIWSIAQLALAFKNEDADSKSRAMMMMMVSILLLVLKSIVTTILQKAGLTDVSIDESVDF